MKWPRISVGAIMAALFVVAIDCAIYRSFAGRPDAASDGVYVVYSTVPMANLLALGIAALVGSRALRTASRWGFAVGASLGVLATVLELKAYLDLIEKSAERWLGPQMAPSSAIVQIVEVVIILVGLPFLFQAVAGLIGAWVGRVIARRRRSDLAEIPRAGRPRLASLLTLLILAGLPAIVVEGYLRLNVDPRFVRFAQGTEAVVDMETQQAMPSLIPATSPIHRLAGRKVRIEKDREPYVVEYFCDSFNGVEGPVSSRDHRPIEVTILDGPMAGQPTNLPHYLLRPLD